MAAARIFVRYLRRVIEPNVAVRLECGSDLPMATEPARLLYLLDAMQLSLLVPTACALSLFSYLKIYSNVCDLIDFEN